MALMGLDIGTTGVKATVFDEDGRILSYAYGEYDIINDGDHYEISPVLLWQATKEVIGRAYREAGGATVQALCTSSLGEAFVMLDKDGRELANSPIYMDKRGEAECAELTAKLGAEEIMKATGHPPHPMYSVYKLMWFARNNPALLKQTYRILLYGDYVLHKLGGQYLADYSLSSRTMCFDVSAKRWSAEILDAAGIDPGIFPETAHTGTVAGEILPSVADEIGVNRGIKLVLGAHDQIMAAIGAGVTRPGQAVNGIGTVDCITPLFKGLRLDAQMLNSGYASVPYLFEDTYVTYAFNMTGGSLLKWFRDTFAARDKEIARLNGAEVYELLDAELPSDPTGLFVVPHFAGSPVPNPDIHGKGAIINLTFGTKRGEIYRACMEGEAYEMRHNLEALEKVGITVDELRTVGGGSRSREWLQIRADIFGKTIVSMECEEAGTLGTAMLAGVASGCYSSITEAADALVKAKAYYYPNERNHQFYTEQYGKYRKLYDLLKAVR